MIQEKPKKVRIFSHKRDISTNNVIDWLINFGCICERINNISISTANEITFSIPLNEKNKIGIAEINSVWFRKNWFYHSELKDADLLVKGHLKEELDTFQAAIFKIYQRSQSIKVLGTNGTTDFYCGINKQYVLFEANELGINIPPTIVSNSVKEIKAFKDYYGSIISKPISDPIFLWGYNSSYSMYTAEIDDSIPNIERCFPTMFQKKIDKNIEIRSFFIDGKFYSSAIFSQTDLKTVEDFRNYNDSQPNRNVPYKLPVVISNKLKKLMKILKLNTGSIDLILSNDGEYYFLEVNPVGQFGMVSNPCNYHLDKIIAEYLKNEK